MTRKYQALEEQEKLLRRNHESMEIEMSEMEVACLQRINDLKEWKRNATAQLKQLYQQLRVAVPQAEYEKLAKDVEIYQQKNGDLLVRNKEWAGKVSGLQRELREASETVDAQRELRGEKDDLEKEFNMVRKRLESLDPSYKWQNQLYQRMVQRLKRSSIGITQAFEFFDKDGDGCLSREEFRAALRKLRLDDLSDRDVDIIISAIDLDGDGRI